jgi:hypothetical protein
MVPDLPSAPAGRYRPLRVATLIAACFGGVLVGLALSSMFPRAAGAAAVPSTSTVLPIASSGIGRTVSSPGALGDPSVATGMSRPSSLAPATVGVPKPTTMAISHAVPPVIGSLPPVVARVASGSESIASGALTSVASSIGSASQSRATSGLRVISEIASGPQRSSSTHPASPSETSSYAARRASAALCSAGTHSSTIGTSTPGPHTPVPASPSGPSPSVPAVPLTGGNDVGLLLTQGSGTQAGHPSRAPLLPAPRAWVRWHELLGSAGVLMAPSLSPPG